MFRFLMVLLAGICSANVYAQANTQIEVRNGQYIGQLKSLTPTNANIDGRIFNIAASLVIYDMRNNIILLGQAPTS